METALTKYILAVITIDPSLVAGGGAPIFYVSDVEEQEKVATYLARITEGVVHDLENGVYIVVKH
ncbi:MAG: hypothetical protein WAO23_05755 [Dethiobacteria bacterium]